MTKQLLRAELAAIVSVGRIAKSPISRLYWFPPMKKPRNSTPSSPLPDRRDFIRTGSHATLAAAVATGTSFASVAHAGGAKRLTTLPSVENSDAEKGRPGIGCVGTGDRWKSVVTAAMQFGDVKAVCDVDSRHLTVAQQFVEQHQQVVPDGYEDYHDVLQRPDIAVVLITTPDHWHAKVAIEAMRAGKDVYCEKPLSLTIEEGRNILRELERTGRVVQVGTQQRSEFEQRFVKAVALCHAGRLGKIQRVVCGINGSPSSPTLPAEDPPTELNWEAWLGQAPWTDYRYLERDKRRPATRCHYEFRWWYEYSGGKMTDWGAHHVDIAQWAIQQSDTGPIRITPKHVVHPVPLDAQGMPTDATQYNTATEFSVECEFPNGVLLEITSQGRNGISIEGDQGQIFVNRQTLTGGPAESEASDPLSQEILQQVCKGEFPQGSHAHMRNFFLSLTTRKQPISDVYSHHRAITTCHLANIALRLGREIRWDPDKEQIINDADADAMQRRVPRTGYEIREVLK